MVYNDLKSREQGIIKMPTTKKSKVSKVEIYSRKVDRGGMYIGEVNWMFELSIDSTFSDNRESLGFVPLKTTKTQIQKVGNQRYTEDLHMIGYAKKLKGIGMMQTELGKFLLN